MNKLLITHEFSLSENQECIMFSIHSENESENISASLKVNNFNETALDDRLVVAGQMMVSDLCKVIDLLKSYLHQAQRDNKRGIDNAML